MQLIFPTSGHAEILGRPVGDVVSEAADRLPSGESVLLRLPHRAGAARVFRAPVRLLVDGRSQPRRAAAGACRHRPGTAAPAAAQVFERHDPAGRDRAGAAERSRGGVPRRADVRPRSARPPRRPLADPGAARSGTHRVLQLAHPRRRGSAVQPGRRGGRRPAGRERPPQRHPGVPGPRLGAGDRRSPAGSARPDWIAGREGDRDLAAALRPRAAAPGRAPAAAVGADRAPARR